MPPLTSTQGSDDFDPYALTDEEVAAAEAQSEETPPSAEENMETVAEPPDVGSEPVEEPAEDIDPLDAAQAEIQRLTKQNHDKDSHIGTLEGENRGLRTVTERFPVADPEPAPAPQSVFDDEGTQSLLRKAYEEDPVQALLLVGKALETESKETVARAVTPLAQQTDEQHRLAAYNQVVNAELADATKTMPGATELVQEYLDNSGTGGKLVEKIQAKAAALQAMGANPQLAAAPGNFKAAIAEILVEGGNVGVTTTSAPATARPKAKNVPERARAEPTPETMSEEERYAQSIVDAVGVTDKIADILK